jgi:hypothetical protein
MPTSATWPPLTLLPILLSRTTAGSGVLTPAPLTETLTGPAARRSVTCTICRGRAAGPVNSMVDVTLEIRMVTSSHAPCGGPWGYDSGNRLVK